MATQTGQQAIGQQEVSFAVLRRRRQQKLEQGVKRLTASEGVLGVMVTTDHWEVITSTFHHNLTHYFKKHISLIEGLGVAAVQDPDPENELYFLRAQTSRFELLLSIANDHRILVVFKQSRQGPVNPLRPAVETAKRLKKKAMEERRLGGMLGAGGGGTFDPCLPHTKRIGGEEKVKITEKILGKNLDQKDDVDKQG